MIEQAAEAAGVRCESVHVTSDFPADTILEAAKKRKCDLIYMASHGRRGITGVLLGSETQKVLAARRDFGAGSSLNRVDRMGFALDFALKTHPGLVRPLNEDAIGADPSCGLFVLADGLGGYNAGEVASVMAISSVLERLASSIDTIDADDGAFTPDEAIYDIVTDINANIYNAALNSTAFEGMATTLVIGWFLGGRLWVAHTGDSRLYRYRDSMLEQLTRDHSFSQELLDAGMVTEEEARSLAGQEPGHARAWRGSGHRTRNPERRRARRRRHSAVFGWLDRDGRQL